MPHVRGAWCRLYYQHVSVVPSEPFSNNHCYIVSLSLLCVFVLLHSQAPDLSEVSGLHVEIKHPLKYPKQVLLNTKCQGAWWLFWRDYSKLWGSCALHLVTVILPQWLYVRISLSLGCWLLMEQSCGYLTVVTFNLPICRPGKNCCDEYLYSDNTPTWCKEIAHKLQSIVDQYAWGHYILHDLFFKNIVAICVQLILTLGKSFMSI